jgi:hypothetical protein
MQRRKDSRVSESLIVHGLDTLFLKWKQAVLCLFAELYRAGKDLPDPAKLLGGLDVKKPREDWMSYDDDYLRETKEHQELLYHFLRRVLLHDQYKRSKSKQLLSDYCHFSLEAYIVLTYYNGYECWKSEVDLERGSESGSSVSELSSVSSRLFTKNCGRGRGMYKGWSADAIYLYKEVVNVLRRQRTNVDRLDVKEFEVNLRARFAEEEGLWLEQGNGGAASTGVQAGNWLEDAAADQREQLNGTGAALGLMPV